LFSEPSSGLSICPIPAVPVHLSMHNLDSGWLSIQWFSMHFTNYLLIGLSVFVGIRL
jgi:hypothetical protein